MDMARWNTVKKRPTTSQQGPFRISQEVSPKLVGVLWRVQDELTLVATAARDQSPGQRRPVAVAFSVDTVLRRHMALPLQKALLGGTSFPLLIRYAPIEFIDNEPPPGSERPCS